MKVRYLARYLVFTWRVFLPGGLLRRSALPDSPHTFCKVGFADEKN